MRVQVVSDLHLERNGLGAADAIVPDADALIIAGDLVSRERFDLVGPFFGRVAPRFRHIVWVPGNHEYWCGKTQPTSMGCVEQDMANEAAPFGNVTVLCGEAAALGAYGLWGGTMWTPLRRDQWREARKLGDYKHCFVRRKSKNLTKLEPRDSAAIHAEHLKSLTQHLEACREVRRCAVVVTHHLPSWQCIDPQYAGADANCCFAADLDAVLAEYRDVIGVWVHGHSHATQRLEVHGVDVVANAMGARDGDTVENPAFEASFCFDV
jgi:hypothetical protein